MVGAQLAIQLIGLLSTIILAPLLIPADFGLVALATTILAGLQALSELSFDVALIQNPRAGRPEYDSAWTLSACRAERAHRGRVPRSTSREYAAVLHAVRRSGG